MIAHLPMPADDCRRVADLLAAILNGRACPLPAGVRKPVMCGRQPVAARAGRGVIALHRESSVSFCLSRSRTPTASRIRIDPSSEPPR